MSSVAVQTAPDRLLVVEDNPVDVRLLRYALSHCRDWKVEIIVAEDGEKAISLLNELVGDDKPQFVILDLNLPKRDGAEVLHSIRNSPALQGLPVAVLSSSPTDVVKGRMAKANVRADCYFTKPMNVEELIAIVEQMHRCFEASPHRSETI